jgi:transmembrane sensor
MDNITDFPDINSTRDQAAQWLVKIDQRPLNQEETEAFQAWIKQSHLHREYFFKLVNNWDSMVILEQLAEILPLSELEASPKKSNMESKGHWFANYPIPLSAAMVIVVCVLAVLTFSKPDVTTEESYVTEVGERKSYQLNDGSSITLNTDSVVRVNYSESKRTVKLLRGEVNFDVAKDKQRPFVVYAGGGMLWAVGTSFNVRFTTGLVDVTVTEGTVKVFSNVAARTVQPALVVATPPNDTQQEAILVAGDTVQYREQLEPQKPLTAETIKRKVAWRAGTLIFRGETLEAALKEIERYTDQDLIIIDPSISNIRIGGHYKVDDIDALIASLSLSLNIKTEKIDNRRIHLSAK